MKILHIIPNLKRGGAERLALDICAEIQKAEELRIKLVAFSESNEYADQTSSIDWEVIPSRYIPSITGKSILEIDNLASFITEFEPDIVHSHLWETELVMSQINTNKAIRFTHFHDNIAQLRNIGIPKNKKDLTDSYEKRIALKSFNKCKHHFICISNDTLNYANNVLPKEHKTNLHLLHNGIHFNNFRNPEKRKNEHLSLINIGSFVPKKNQKFAIDILHELIQGGVAAELTLLGDGPLLEEVKHYTSKLDLTRQVHFRGNVDDVAHYLHQSTIYLHTANYEPFGLVLLEAMAAGLPVVSLDGGGNRDIIEHRKNGFLFQEEDPKKFAATIMELSNNKKIYDTIEAEGTRTAKKHDIKQYVNQLLDLYKASISSTN